MINNLLNILLNCIWIKEHPVLQYTMNRIAHKHSSNIAQRDSLTF